MRNKFQHLPIRQLKHWPTMAKKRMVHSPSSR